MANEEKKISDRRIRESRSQVATVIGFLRCENDPTQLSGEVLTLPQVVERLWTALDRLDRAIEGEDYIEKQSKLSEEIEGYHFTPPPLSSLPKERSNE